MRVPLLRLLAALALLASGCREQEPIRVGLVSGLSGRHSDLGVSSRNGALLAVDALNAAGGVGGRPIELVVRDDRQDPEVARAAVEELSRLGVVALVGHATSAMAEATLPILDRERVLMVSPTVSATTFQGRDDWFVMLYPSNAVSARTLVAHVAAEGKARRVAVLQDLSNALFATTWLEAFRGEVAAKGGAVQRVVSFTSGAAPSWGTLAAEALEDGPDAVLLIANAFDTAALAQQLAKRAPGVQLLGTDWGFTSDAVANGGAAVEGALFTLKVDVTSQAPRLVAFRRGYQERFGRAPDFAAVLAAEAVGVIADGLGRARTREALREAILGRSYEGLIGPIAVDRNGDAQREVFIMSVRDGRVVRVR